MARTPLRPDIAAARARTKFSLGSGRELRHLAQLLTAGETVSAMTRARYQGCFGLAVLTDTRFLFLCHGFIWKVTEDISVDRISLVQWRTVFGVGTMTVHAGAVPLEFTGVRGLGGTAVVQGLRKQGAGRDVVDRKVREGILLIAEHVAAAAPEAAMAGFPDEVRETYFSGQELLTQSR
ncbi:hypothetical protein [Arthrobacter sp. UYCo732]|uniref:hypothetical protein n=1 Tax=Arthrobacter sp. UYCo732 TaxID=3156336 RepID=UPI003396DFCA